MLPIYSPGHAAVLSSDQAKGLALACSSAIFIGSSFIIKKKGLRAAGASGIRAGDADCSALSGQFYIVDAYLLQAFSYYWHGCSPVCAARCLCKQAPLCCIGTGLAHVVMQAVEVTHT